MTQLQAAYSVYCLTSLRGAESTALAGPMFLRLSPLVLLSSLIPAAVHLSFIISMQTALSDCSIYYLAHTLQHACLSVLSIEPVRPESEGPVLTWELK